MAIAMGVAAESINVVPRPFGKLVIPTEQQLYASADGMVNVFKDLRPVLPGHMVIAPSRTDDVALLSKLADAELTCLVAAIHEVQARAEGADAFNIAIQDGAAAGQPVLLQSHVHIHVVPRVAGDLENNDEIYDKIATWSPEGEPTVPPPFYVPSDEERKPRTAEQMAEEARKYAAHAAHERIAWRLYGENGVGGEPLPDAPFQFGKFMLDASQLFYSSKLSVATVNLKPLCPGHVLCVPKRNVARMADLEQEEREDLWRMVREVQQIVMECHGSSACKIGVQDGREAGQSVPHVHVHVLPQKEV